MVWEAKSENGGFSAGKTWLPVPPEHLPRAVSAQEGDLNSVLHHYRRFLQFRRQHLAFAKGEIEFLPLEAPLLGFLRTHGNEKILCLFNMSAQEQRAKCPAGPLEVLEGHGFASQMNDGDIAIPAWSGFFARFV